jgi:4-carboxymuconolactone decarboxylase
VRLRHLRPDELDPEQQALYHTLTDGLRGRDPNVRSDVGMTDGEGRLQGPFNAMLHHPRLGDALQEVSRCLRFDGVLSTRAREAVILVVAASQRSDFEWVAHASIAASLGFSGEQIAAFAARSPVSLDDPIEAAAAELARALVEDGDADDATYARTQAVLGDAGVFEVSTTVGVYQLLAQQMRLFRVPSPPGPWHDTEGAP